EHKRWVGGAARIVAGLIIAEMLDARRANRPGAWTWASIAEQIRAMDDVTMISRAALGDSTIRTLIPSAFSTGKLTRDEIAITNTIPEGIDVVKMLAATDAARPDALRFSLRRWLSREAHREIDTVIFNFDENYKSAGGLIFGAMLDVVSSTVNSSLPNQSADAPDGLWFIVDEAPQLGAEGLTKLMGLDAVARSRGLRLIIAAQDESQFVSALGRDKALTLLALAGTRIYSQVSPDVARAICDRVGERKIIQITNTAAGGAVQGKVAAPHVLPALLASDLTGLIVRRPRWWKPWAATGAEVIMQSGPTLGRLLQPFGTLRADTAEAFMPCAAWQWGEHHAGDVTRSNAPVPTHATDGLAPPILPPILPEPSPFGPDESPTAPEPDEPLPFDDPEPEDFDWTKE
ncbi:Type IV secretory pathway VirD4 component-like protein, partial [mine drainage metagenome]